MTPTTFSYGNLVTSSLVDEAEGETCTTKQTTTIKGQSKGIKDHKKGLTEVSWDFYQDRMNYQAVLCYFLLVLCPSSQTQPRLTRRFRDGDKQVLIFDKLFPTEVVRSYYDLVTSGSVAGKISSWFYTYSDYYQDIGTLNTSSNSPWIAPVNPEFFSSTALWKISHKVVEKVTGGKEYFPYDVSFSMHRRLDFITATSKGKGKFYLSLSIVKLIFFLL